MKKAVSVVLMALAMSMLFASLVSAIRMEDKEEPMKAEGCKVYKWVNPLFNRVFVFKAFKHPESCYVVVDITNERNYGDALAVARIIMPKQALPETIGRGTEFNYARVPQNG